MRGDFSTFWKKESRRNFNGVLHQQGRVLLDRDWNAQTEIVNDWQETAAADMIGAGVAAVASDAAASFKVTAAKIVTDVRERIEITVNEGHVWADGLLIESRQTVEREAAYLEPPVQTPKASIPVNPPNNPVLRDAVILEAWHEELNAFQMPDLLIEPALGGVDTTERFQTAYRFRLFRMNADDTCDSIIERLRDDFENKGKLTAVLREDTTTDGDCPVPKGGGYTGFEHRLYRIEIAQTKHTEAYFKWSPFNGGLVGRGRFVGSGAARKVKIDANLNAILNSDATSFYLETLERKNGYWQVTFGAKVTLNTSEGTLSLPADANDDFFGLPPTPETETFFFRLWNGIEKIGDFTTEKDLQDGIRLKFDAEGVGKYTPHDFWTFTVRAGEIENPKTLVDHQKPQGIYYHRVPLAELNWTSATLTAESGAIEDCRRIFQPLTKLKGCCTYRVGDGVRSHGDFTSIQEAVDHLPADGGQICILPGEYRENVVLKSPRNRNISIKGCGYRTRIIPERDQPVIWARGGTNLKIESLAIAANERGVTGILLEGDEIVANDEDRKEVFGGLRNVRLEDLRIVAAKESAIELRVGQYVSVRGCQIFVEDVETEWQSAVYLAGDDLLFEENEIRVMNAREEKLKFGKTDDPRAYRPARRAAGGLHLAGGCERVRVINNLIIGGTGNGITLGNVDLETDGKILRHFRWQRKSGRRADECDHQPGVIIVTIIDENTRFVAGDPLRDILIERNRIFSMGLNGIGIDGFFVMEDNPNRLSRFANRRIQFISVENLTITGNRIEYCLNRLTTELDEANAKYTGFGGIALSDVGNLSVRDNFITDNGASYLEPVCGIYVLRGRGVEISRNRILNNGRREGQKTDRNLKTGVRGGIYILYAIDGVIKFGHFFRETAVVGLNSLPSGVPALKMHENIVSAPVGRALTVGAVGNVAVTDNQFMSQGLVPQFDLSSFLAATVLIFGYNASNNVQNQPQTFVRYSTGDVKTTMKAAAPVGRSASPNFSNADMVENISISAAGKIPIQAFNGAIHFAGNQCRLIGAGSRSALSALASILILSLSDIGFLANQSDCAMRETRLATDTLIFGANVRASDNSWMETNEGVLFSAATFGGNLNTTTDNQSRYCLLILGRLMLAKHNLTLFDLENGLAGDITDPAKQRTPCQTKRQRQILGYYGSRKTINRDGVATNPGIRINNQ